VLFRPEEVHGASGIADILIPSPERNGHMSNDTVRFGVQEGAILHLQPNRQPAIQTGRINSDCFTRKEPADRQRLERSLGKPLLLAINGDTILSGQVVERRKRCD
jgi:hypothetical protein